MFEPKDIEQAKACGFTALAYYGKFSEHGKQIFPVQKAEAFLNRNLAP